MPGKGLKQRTCRASARDYETVFLESKHSTNYQTHPNAIALSGTTLHFLFDVWGNVKFIYSLPL